MQRRILIAASFIILMIVGPVGRRSDYVGVSAQAPAITGCSPIPPPPCKEDASPGVIQIIPEGSSKLKLARKRFYLSSCPFNLSASVDVISAPTLRNLYRSIGATPQLIKWLEENHCETIYCRPLTMDEVNCEGGNPSNCVPEFGAAYLKALGDLKGDKALALKMITNYPPLSNATLRVSFYEARAKWLETTVKQIESAVASQYHLRSTITDKDGTGFFYDLCPGSYYVSSIAPIDIDGTEIVWESTKPINVEGPPNKNDATKVTLAFAASNKKNTIVGKTISDFTKPKPAAQ